MTKRIEAPLPADVIEKIKNYGTHAVPYDERAETVIALCDMALASLSLPAPCGHPSQYVYSEDGGKANWCLLCERKRLSSLFDVHVDAVQKFLNELYAVMVDPCAEGTRTVAEVKEALLKAAIRDRDAAAAAAPRNQALAFFMAIAMRDGHFDDDPIEPRAREWLIQQSEGMPDELTVAQVVEAVISQPLTRGQV